MSNAERNRLGPGTSMKSNSETMVREALERHGTGAFLDDGRFFREASHCAEDGACGALRRTEVVPPVPRRILKLLSSNPQTFLRRGVERYTQSSKVHCGGTIVSRG